MQAERILEGNLPSPESGEGAAALCTSVDNRGRRTNVFLITGGPAAASPRPASSYARDVLTGFDAILESCEFCPEEKMVDGKSSCVVGGTNAAAGNGALGIWLIGEIPDGASAE